MLMTAMGGLSLGLLISSLVADPKTAANIVPLVLIPQIIMGGALIKYEDMNRNLALVYTLSHWFSEHPSTDQSKKMESKLEVPFVCQFIAMRWSYEEMIVAQAKLNPLTRRQDRAQREIQQIVAQHSEITPEERKRLDDLKEVLAVALRSGSDIPSSELDRYLRLVDPDPRPQTTSSTARSFQERDRPGHGRADLCESEGLRSDLKRRDGAKRLSPRQSAERFLRRAKTLFRH